MQLFLSLLLLFTSVTVSFFMYVISVSNS